MCVGVVFMTKTEKKERREMRFYNIYSSFAQVERLVDRLQSSTLLDDRRDACRALKALSRTYRVEVGAQGMDPLRQVLEIDKTDCEIISLALDTLCNITNPQKFDEEGNNHHIYCNLPSVF